MPMFTALGEFGELTTSDGHSTLRTMLTVFDPERFERAAARFRDFFNELRHVFVEREGVIAQFELALLSREHVLMTGPPGTAKSQMAASVLQRIIDESTGEPSVFARQFTENTVQTDLIGPIDFKTLVESGRTTHFTDEGMLGAVHAFLDEVFDGRDMLLRSTLNLLQERELKQGDVITRGKIECAFMTSNRYISEILESSREPLLAFIDRIAFVSFIPRGFADTSNFELVVRRHGGGFGLHRLNSRLTVQDLDVLQDAADRTFVPDKVCDRLAHLVRDLDGELAAAMRADPNFTPTRYFSTRTAVRAAGVLRAAVVLDKIHSTPKRRLQVGWDDLEALCYFLMLSGLSREQIGELMKHETDTRERRQLDIMRTEAEIFARCFAKLTRAELPPEPPAVDINKLRAMSNKARRSGDLEALEKAAHTLASASESGARGADQAGRLLVKTVGSLSEQALRAGMLTPAATTEKNAIELVQRLTSVADHLESASGASSPLSHWLRGRLVEFLDESLRLAPAVTVESLTTILHPESGDSLLHQARARLKTMLMIKGLRHQLESRGAWIEDKDRSREAWQGALDKLEGELGLLFDSKVRAQVMQILDRTQNKSLSEVLEAISSIAKELDTFGRMIESLGGRRQLNTLVMGAHIEPVVASVFERMEVTDRNDVIKQVEAVATELQKSDLDSLIDVDKFVLWTAPIVIRGERQREVSYEPVRSQQAYEEARGAEDSLSLVETLVEVVLRLMPPETIAPEVPQRTTESIREVIAGLPEELQQEVIDLDLARIERGIGCLEDWWASISASKDVAKSKPKAAVAMLEEVVSSGFLRVMRGDGELLHMVMATRNLAEIFPKLSEPANVMRRRVEQLDSVSGAVLIGLLEGSSHRLWRASLENKGS